MGNIKISEKLAAPEKGSNDVRTKIETNKKKNTADPALNKC